MKPGIELNSFYYFKDNNNINNDGIDIDAKILVELIKSKVLSISALLDASEYVILRNDGNHSKIFKIIKDQVDFSEIEKDNRERLHELENHVKSSKIGGLINKQEDELYVFILSVIKTGNYNDTIIENINKIDNKGKKLNALMSLYKQNRIYWDFLDKYLNSVISNLELEDVKFLVFSGNKTWINVFKERSSELSINYEEIKNILDLKINGIKHRTGIQKGHILKIFNNEDNEDNIIEKLIYISPDILLLALYEIKEEYKIFILKAYIKKEGINSKLLIILWKLSLYIFNDVYSAEFYFCLIREKFNIKIHKSLIERYNHLLISRKDSNYIEKSGFLHSSLNLIETHITPINKIASIVTGINIYK